MYSFSALVFSSQRDFKTNYLVAASPLLFAPHFSAIRLRWFFCIPFCRWLIHCAKIRGILPLPSTIAVHCVPRGFSRNGTHLVNAKQLDSVLVRENIFPGNYKRYVKTDKCSWNNILRANLCPNVAFGSWPFSWSSLPIFWLWWSFSPIEQPT